MLKSKSGLFNKTRRYEWSNTLRQRTSTLATCSRPERVQYILTNCVARGGTLESVTVAAGTFDASKMAKTAETEESKEIWIADAAFGIVKMIEHDIEDGEHFSVELRATAVQ